MSNESILENQLDSNGVITVGRLFQHLQNPQNLLGYLVFSAWCKFMGITQYIPTITVGG